MKRVLIISVLAAMVPSLVAASGARQVTDRSEFIGLVEGKTISRPLVKLNVSPDGRISGKGAKWAVSGEWSWQNGYFCRSLDWGGKDLGYNCQRVTVDGGSISFTSDKGKGRSAEFSLR
ncbi:dihydrodipicolinate reductase [Algirhabdus cladophorae]|uniref:dihydrodipicolinate reductase n=1 Tax=Algirhabdus cladophorae TaxID=3377108 RepID=UPI003B849B6A